MIKATELRIGNLILVHGVDYDAAGNKYHDPEMDSVAPVDIDILKDIEKGSEGYSPLLLTPEWLERCGFAWDKENEVFTIQVGNALYLEVDKDFDCALTPEHLPGGSLYTWSVNKYVHRLQNLVFALTGTELEIKLP